MPAEITDQAHLEKLPDGTIISWRRIPGDPTSQAVAFIHHEVQGKPGVMGSVSNPDALETVTWISPGGWQPMTICEAGITYPVTVIRPGGTDTRSTEWPGGDSELSGFVPMMESMTGGTWAREKALEYATQWTLSEANTLQNVTMVLAIAEQFEAWLDRDPSADDVPEIDQAPSLGELAEQLTRLKVVGVTRAALMYAVDHVWHEETDQ